MMLVLKIKLCLFLFTVDAVLVSAILSPDVSNGSTPSLNLSQTATTFQAINGSLNGASEPVTLYPTTPRQTSISEINNEYIVAERKQNLNALRNVSDTNDNQTFGKSEENIKETENEAFSSEEDLFGVFLTSDYSNITTERWDEDYIQNLQNTSVEDIFKSTENKDEFTKNASDMSLDKILQKWLSEETPRQKKDGSEETLIEDVNANGLFVVQNSTNIFEAGKSNKTTQEDAGKNKTFVLDQAKNDLSLEFLLTTDRMSTAERSSIALLSTMSTHVTTEKWNNNYMVEFQNSLTTTSYLDKDMQKYTEDFSTVHSVTTDSVATSTSEDQQQSTTVRTSTDDDVAVENDSVVSNVIGSLQNENGITCITLSCAIQIFINDTPITMPQNFSILANSLMERGSIAFTWFNNDNNNITLVFNVQSKEEYYYVDSIRLSITDVAAFQEDAYAKKLNINKNNLQLFETRVGTTLKIDRGLLVPIGKGVVIYFFKIRFSALDKLFNVDKLSSGISFSDYFVEILSIFVGLTLLCIILVFICKKYRLKKKAFVSAVA